VPEPTIEMDTPLVPWAAFVGLIDEMAAGPVVIVKPPFRVTTGFR